MAFTGVFSATAFNRFFTSFSFFGFSFFLYGKYLCQNPACPA